MLVKNEEYTDTVIQIGANGEGVVNRDGVVVFVPFALIGEKIRYKILKNAGRYAFGKLMEVYTPAEQRVRAKCSVFGKCGGCQLQHMKYNEQLRVKENCIKGCFKKIAGLDIEVLPTVKSDKQFRYRNKLQLPVISTFKGTVLGFYAENSHRVVPIDDCPINAEWTKDVITAFKKYIDEFSILGYDVVNKTGELREIVVREIFGSLLVTAVVCDLNIRGIDRLIELLNENLHEYSLYLNENKKDTNVVFGERFVLKYGKPYYQAEMLGIKYQVGVQSFMQVNQDICYKLYSAVSDTVSLKDDEAVVIDAYSGAGLMTAILAKHAKRAYGIEVVPEAVTLANELANANGLEDKIINNLSTCEEALPKIIDKEKGEKLYIVLDPPRKGCDISVVNAVKESGAEKIVYISCNPATLARDVGILTGALYYDGADLKKRSKGDKSVDNGASYEIVSVRPFDMFAQTRHIETLVTLQKR